MHYRKQELCRVSKAYGEAQKSLGKGFAECYTRQTAQNTRQPYFFAEAKGAEEESARSLDVHKTPPQGATVRGNILRSPPTPLC